MPVFITSLSLATLLPFVIALVADVVSIFIFSYFLYYRRYRDRQGFVTYMLFNIFLFIVVYFLGHTDVSMTVGFAIFGLLGLVRLRSDTFSKVDITYFIGALTIALSNALVTHRAFLFAVNTVIIGATLFVDSRRFVRKKYQKMLYTLDQIPASLFTNKKETLTLLGKQLHVAVIDYDVITINAVKDSVEMWLVYRSFKC